MRVSPKNADVVSGQTVTFTIECEPCERLWDYAVFRKGRLVGPAQGTLRGMDSVLGKPYPVDALYDPIPYSEPGATVTFNLSTVGWGRCSPPGHTSIYKVRFRSVACRSGLREGLRFWFPHVEEDRRDTWDSWEVKVRVRNLPLVSDERLAEAVRMTAGAIGIVDPRTLEPVKAVEPGAISLILVNLARLAETRELSVEDILDIESSVTASYNGDGKGFERPDRSSEAVFMVFLFPHLSVGRGPPTAPIADDSPRRGQETPPCSIGVGGGRPTAPTFRDLGLEAADVLRPLAIPFRFPDYIPTCPRGSRFVFELLHRGSAGHPASPVARARVLVVGRAFQGPPYTDRPGRSSVATNVRKPRVYRGALVLYGLESEHMTVPARYSGYISFIEDRFREATRGSFSLRLDGPFVLNPERIDRPMVDGRPATYVDWFFRVQKAAKEKGHPAFPVDVPTDSEFHFETCERLARISFHRSAGDVRQAISSLTLASRCPDFLRTWADKRNNYTLFVVSGVPLDADRQLDAWSPEPGMVLLPAISTDRQWFVNETRFVDPDLGAGVWFNYGDLDGRAADIRTRWDPSDPGRNGNFSNLRDLLREFGRNSLGSHVLGMGRYTMAPRDEEVPSVLPFGSEPALLSFWGRVFQGERVGPSFAYDSREIASLASMGPRVSRLTIEEINGDPETGRLSMSVFLSAWSVYPFMSVTLSVIAGGREHPTGRELVDQGTNYLCEKRLSVCFEPGSSRGGGKVADRSEEIALRVRMTAGSMNGEATKVAEDFHLDLRPLRR